MDYYEENGNTLEEEMDEWEESDEVSLDLEETSFVCEDCDYRWEDLSEEEMDSGMIVCPMCGSVNVTQL